MSQTMQFIRELLEGQQANFALRGTVTHAVRVMTEDANDPPLYDLQVEIAGYTYTGMVFTRDPNLAQITDGIEVLISKTQQGSEGYPAFLYMVRATAPVLPPFPPAAPQVPSLQIPSTQPQTVQPMQQVPMTQPQYQQPMQPQMQPPMQQQYQYPQQGVQQYPAVYPGMPQQWQQQPASPPPLNPAPIPMNQHGVQNYPAEQWDQQAPQQFNTGGADQNRFAGQSF